MSAGPELGAGGVELQRVALSYKTLFINDILFCRKGGNDGSDIFSLSTIWYIKI